MQIFVETLTSKAIAFDVMGVIQTIIKDAKTIEAEVVDAKDSNASVQDKSQVNKVEEEAKAVNTSCELVASGHDIDALVEKTFPGSSLFQIQVANKQVRTCSCQCTLPSMHWVANACSGDLFLTVLAVGIEGH